MIVVDASALLEFLLQTPLGIRSKPAFFGIRTSSIRRTWRTWK
jgi:hypothetical protein